MASIPSNRLVLLTALCLGAVGCGGGGGGSGGGAGGEGGEGGSGADPVTVSIADVEAEEGDAGATEVTFTVTLSHPSQAVVRVPWQTQDRTAFAHGEVARGRVDYDESSATLRFEPGETEQTLDVTINGDALNEEDETFAVVLGEPTGAQLADGEAEGRIVNDDALPVVAVASATFDELDSGIEAVQLELMLSAPMGRSSSVNWTALDGSAMAGEDYLAEMGRVVFGPGETSKTIQVALIGDPVDEPDETFDIELSSPVNCELADPLATVTIIDNDLPAPAGPALSVSNATVNEGNAGFSTLQFTISLSEVTTANVSVEYATIDDTATASGVPSTGGRDYVAASDVLTFLPGETSKQVSVSVYGDTLNEATESFSLELINPMGAVVADAQGLGTITNDDASATISVADVTVTEGAAATKTAAFIVSLSMSSGSDVSVDFATADGTADAGDDYVASSGTLTIPAGQSSGVVLVEVGGDLLHETSETFYLDLSDAVGATILDNQALATISNDDALPEVSIDDVSVTEGDAGITNAVFSITLDTPSGQSVSVAWTTSNGTADASDFASGSGNLTFPAGTTLRTVSIPISGDTSNESNETFTIDLYSPSNCTIADAQGVGTIITDDSALPALNIADANVSEQNAGTVTLSLTVTLETASAQQVTVDFATSNGTASSASDYASTSGTLTFDIGETTKTVDITINGDTLHEPDETVLVTLSGASNAFVADGGGIGTINDDDTAPTLSINDVVLTEGNSGSKNATFTVSLSASSGFPVSVTYATADSTAEEAGLAALGQDDYDAASDVLVIAAGATSAQVTVPIKGDTLAEADETFSVQLSSPQNATLADGQGQCTISNDDTLPTLTIDDVSLVEGDAGTKTFTFTVTLSSASGSQVSVSFATANGTASSPSDYTARGGTVVLVAGQTTATIDITVVGEQSVEGNKDETFYVNLSNAVGATIADNQGLGTILSDD